MDAIAVEEAARVLGDLNREILKFSPTAAGHLEVMRCSIRCDEKAIRRGGHFGDGSFEVE